MIIAAERDSSVSIIFTRQTVEFLGLHDLFQLDLVEITPYSQEVESYNLRMIVINAFSKFAFAITLKTKTGAEIASALADRQQDEVRTDGQRKRVLQRLYARLIEKIKRSLLFYL